VLAPVKTNLSYNPDTFVFNIVSTYVDDVIDAPMVEFVETLNTTNVQDYLDDVKTKKRYRADHLIEEFQEKHAIDLPEGWQGDVALMTEIIAKHGIKSPEGNELGEVRQFNMMFKTHVGATEGSGSVSYLRPETAQGIFVNFKNVLDSFHPKLPFGIAQIGKAFRNEITPRDFIFRVRELEQMEVEYFIAESDWEKYFDEWLAVMHRYIEMVGLDPKSVHELDVPDGDRAHYSKRTIDFEYDFPFGRKELYGLAYRTNYDLSKHQEHSKVKLEYLDDETKEKFVPHVIEPSLGVDRTVLAILCDAYREDSLGADTRTYLALKPSVAPVKAAVFPLKKNNEELQKKAREIFAALRKEVPQVMFDDNANVGKRYRRQDEIGTPLCFTVDFDTLEDGTVTVRDRDTGEQRRVSESEIVGLVKGLLQD
jgi:glycyl-tRNA synthetase